jgi:hypothetical protein
MPQDALSASSPRQSLPWDLQVFHQAVLHVYARLADVVAVINSEPSRSTALRTLDQVLENPGDTGSTDPTLAGRLKRVMGGLRMSLNAANTIRNVGAPTRRTTRIGAGVDHTLGNIMAMSFHDVVIAAGAAMLERRASDVIRNKVIDDVTDAEKWDELGRNLREEIALASLVPVAPPPAATPQIAPKDPLWLLNKIRDDVAAHAAARDPHSKTAGNAPAEATPATKTDDSLVTVEEASAILKRPAKTIRNWIKRKNSKLNAKDHLGGPRHLAARYRLGDIRAREPESE